MNKSYLKYISLAVFLSAIVACAEFGSIDTVSDDGVWDVTASLSMSVDSKITEVGNALFWQEGDQVAFKAVSGNVESEQAILTLNRIDSGLPEAKFKGSVTMTNAPEKCWFAYPSDAVIAKDGSVTFDFSVQDGRTHAPYLYGAADYSEDGIKAVLKHAAAMIRLTVPEGVTKVEVSANSLNQDVVNDLATQKISKVTVAQDGSMSVLDDALDKITVTVQPASVNYVFVPAMNFIDGFSFIMTTAEGEMMVKSYSIDGGKFSDYQFDAGSVLDIDLSGDKKPEGISISCELSDAVHQFENGLLTGTNISVESFTVSGVPDKIIDEVGVAVYEGLYGEEGSVLVRFWHSPGGFNGNPAPLGVQNTWPLLLPEKTYNAYAICQINGKERVVHIGEITIPELPEFTLSLSAETSYTIYKKNGYTDSEGHTGAKAANKLDGKSLCNITAVTNIHQSLLNNSNYGLHLLVKTGVTSQTKTAVSNTSSNSYDFGTWSGNAPGSYKLQGSLIFAGKSVEASLENLPITGIPSTFTDIGTLNNSTVTKNFYVEEDIPISVAATGTVTGQGNLLGGKTTNFTISISGEQTYSLSAKGGALYADKTENITANITDKRMSVANPSITLKADNDNAVVSSMTVQYRD